MDSLLSLQCKLKKNFLYDLVNSILHNFSGSPILSSIPSVVPFPNARKLLLTFSGSFDKLLQTVTTFCANLSLIKLNTPEPLKH